MYHGILGQVWYLIVSIPDVCTLTYFKDIVNLAIILVPLIMILSRGHTEQIKGLSLLGDNDLLTGVNKVVPCRD